MMDSLEIIASCGQEFGLYTRSKLNEGSLVIKIKVYSAIFDYVVYVLCSY